jgi:hypothetical protein
VIQKRGTFMNLKLTKLFSVSGLVAVVVATCVPAVYADHIVGPGVVEYERTTLMPAATAVTTEKVLEHRALMECAPAASTTTVEKIVEEERWTGPTTVARKTFLRRAAPRKRMTMARRPAARRYVARKLSARRYVARAPRIIERVVQKTVVVEKPVIIEKQVAIEKPVFIERVVEKPVLIEKCVEQPVLIERTIEKPVIIEKTIQQPVIIQEKKRKHLLNLKVF